MSEARRPKILCCDDEKLLCEIIAEQLEDAGFEVVQAYSGNDALAKLATTRVDAILSDIRMPDGDGLELLKALRAQNPERPIVLFMTGYTEMSHSESYHQGVEGIFSKPIDYPSLIESLHRVVKTPHERYAKRQERVDVKATISLRFASVAHAASAHLINIGRGGCFLATSEADLRKGNVVEIKIAFDDGSFSPLEGRAVCRWVRKNGEQGMPDGAGLEFLDLSEESIERLLKLLESFPTKSYIPQV